jgi:hypothetical protein
MVLCSLLSGEQRGCIPQSPHRRQWERKESLWGQVDIQKVPCCPLTAGEGGKQVGNSTQILAERSSGEDCVTPLDLDSGQGLWRLLDGGEQTVLSPPGLGGGLVSQISRGLVVQLASSPLLPGVLCRWWTLGS